MVKKLDKTSAKKPRASAKLLDGQLAQTVKDSAQQIWLAGMGAFGKAQGEGGKFFETLVKEGLNLQRRTQGLAEDKINEVTGRMSEMAGTVTAKAGQNWDKLESIFEQRTAKALGKLGVPSAKDVEVLTQRVEELAGAVARLAKAGGLGKSAAKAAPKATPRAAAKAAGRAPGKAGALATKAGTGTPVTRKAATRRAPRKAVAAA